MSDRAEILRRLQQRNMRPVAFPGLDGPWVTYSNPAEQFVKVLHEVGGESLEVPSMSEIPNALEQRGIVEAETKVVSTLSGSELPAVARPHDFADFDVGIVIGKFGVAENAAVWLVDHGTEPHRACLFLVEHLVLVIRREAVVNNMHEAYERIGSQQAGFGVFISGPSKTADIEQSLVIGAQGPRQHTVVLVG